MIGKIPKTGKGFRGSFNYLMRGKRDAENPERLAWMETRNLFVDDMEKIPRMMRATAAQSKRCQKPVYHFLVSWHEDEAPADVTMRQVADRALADLGLHEHQAVLAAHRDTKHRHLHILVNRVHPETGKAWHTGKDWERLERSVARQASELGFVKVDGRHNTPEKMAREAKRARDSEYQMATRKQGTVPLDRWSIEEIRSRRNQLAPLFDQARSWDHLARLLEGEGLSLTIKGQGLVIDDGMGFMKLSDLGKGVRLKGLETLYRESFFDFDRRREIERQPAPDKAPAPTPEAKPYIHQQSPTPADDKDAIRAQWRASRGIRQAERRPTDQSGTDDGTYTGTPIAPRRYAPLRDPAEPAPKTDAYARVLAARERLDFARDMHGRGMSSKQDLMMALDAHAVARDNLAKLLEQEPGKQLLRQQWQQQHEAQRHRLEAKRPPPPKHASTSGNASADTATAPPAREIPTRPAAWAPRPSPRQQALQRVSHAYEQMDLAQQLHALGLLSKQELAAARDDLTAARDHMSKHQTLNEFVGQAVRQALKPRKKPAPAPAKSPAEKPAPKPDKVRKPQTRKKDRDRDR